MRSSPLRRDLLAATLLGVLATLYRAWLSRRYWGHEEEDWGNLVIIRGVLDSQFGYVEVEHMPLYSWLAALATMATGDPRAGGLLVSVLLGGLGVGLVTWIARRWICVEAGWLAGLILLLQPESALYSATTLRESTFTAFSLAAVLALGTRAGALGGLLVGLAFLARFNAAFTLLPALAVWVLWQRRRSEPVPGRPLLAAAGAAAVVLGWSAFYKARLGTWAFWGGVLSRNTGDAVSDLSAPERVTAVLKASGGLFGVVLPLHVGPAVLLLAAAGAVALARGSRGERGRWLLLCSATTVGLLATTAAVSTYEWHHNLYWKWLTPAVPFLALLGAEGLNVAGRRWGNRGWLAAALLLVCTSLPFWAWQTRFQVQRSAAWYGTQVELARWVERAWPPGVAVLTEAIPAWYLEARRSPVRVVSWLDPDLPKNDPEAFGEYLDEQQIVVAMWFAEEWVGAQAAAPFLADGHAVQAGPAILLPIAREDGYGFIAYLASQAPGLPEPREPPPRSAGAWGLAGSTP